MTDDAAGAPRRLLHRSAADGYASGADAYVSGRPDYPAVVDAWLRDVALLRSGSRVLEVGAGTGAFTARLAALGTRVWAVEPVEAMRTRLAARVPSARVVAGAAEALPIRDGSADLVVCAQSFHWFATGSAVREFHRVLAPGGRLVLVWNVRDETVRWVRDLSDITDAVEGDTPRYKTGRWRDALGGPEFVGSHRLEAPHAHSGPVAQVVVARTLSVSFVAALPPARRHALERALETLIDGDPVLAGRGVVTFPYRTVMHVYRRRP